MQAHTIVGDDIVLTLAGGGEIRAPRSLVTAIGPDEPPTPDAPAPRPAPAVETSPGTLRTLVDQLAQRYGVDPGLAHAVIEVESNYEPRAVSSKGAMGLMQLMPDVAREYTLSDPFDPAQNLAAGLQHLRDLLQRFSPEQALAAYNAGEGAVERYGGVPPFQETRQYVARACWRAGRAVNNACRAPYPQPFVEMCGLNARRAVPRARMSALS